MEILNVVLMIKECVRSKEVVESIRRILKMYPEISYLK